MFSSKEKKIPISWLFLASGVVILVWGANFYLPFFLNWGDGKRGTFGDMFGVANSIFSGLAFVGVVYAILLQRSEVSIAREELDRTKTMLNDQSTALKEQNNAAKLKSFEDTFFQMLSLHNEILSQIDLVDGPRITSGRDVIASLWARLGSKHNYSYSSFYDKNGKEVGHYFRMLFNIFKFIDEKAPVNPKFYSNLVRAQLSDIEVAMLMVNGLSEHGVKFKPLIEHYHLLKHLKEKQFVQSRVDAKAYSASAFGKEGNYPEFIQGN